VSDFKKWQDDGRRNNWSLPPIAWWPFRLPVIRQIRAAWNAWMVERHYEAFACLGLVRTGYDEWVIYAIAKGIC
jgi:hypothetical protein